MRSTVVLLLLVVGCAAETTTDPAPELHCSGRVITTEAGERYHVECTRPVDVPPVECEQVDVAAYDCNTLHTYAEFCDTFAGICEEP